MKKPPQPPKLHKNNSYILIIFIILILSSIVGFTIYSFHSYHRQHDKNLENFANHLYQIPLPENTTIKNTHKEFGLLGAMSHNCGYLTSANIESTLTFEKLKTYYEQYQIPPADPDGLMINFDKRGNSSNSIYVTKINDNSYQISSIDANYNYFDIRCGF